MADVRVRNKKTGEEKTLPSRVAGLLKNMYVILGDAPVKPVVSAPVQTLAEATGSVTAPELVNVTKKNEVVVAESNGPVTPVAEGPKEEDDIEALRTEYETKLGKKPHGRMGVESLKKALENA